MKVQNSEDNWILQTSSEDYDIETQGKTQFCFTEAGRCNTNYIK